MELSNDFYCIYSKFSISGFNWFSLYVLCTKLLNNTLNACLVPLTI